MTTSETVTLAQVSPAGAPPAEAVIPRQIGPVKLLREIGRGGMGVVWLGRHQVLARDVAVKFLLQADSNSGGPGFQDLLAEARAAGAVQHPGLIAVHDAAVVRGVPYLVMDYVDGVTVADVLRAAGPLHSGLALAVLDAVTDAVAALHDAGLVHRDLKPRNILLDHAGRPLVGDFGLACACAPARRAQLAFAGGTPPYMAPEMFSGEASPRSDVYALGVMLYELLAGAQPFRGATFEEIRAKHEDEPLPLEPLVRHGATPAIIEVLERATHKTALYRIKTARHFMQALHAAVPDNDVWLRGVREWRQLVGRCGRETVRQSLSQPSTATLSTCTELLASKAALKRASKTALRDTAPTDDSASEVKPADAREEPAERVLCVTCGYNLRGLREEGRCPECGTLVARSLDADRLAAADSSWLEGICRGQVYIVVGAALFLTVFFFLGGGLLLTGSGDVIRRAPYAGRVVVVGYALVCALALSLTLIGVMRVTTLDPRLSLARQPLSLRRLSRGAAIAALLYAPLWVGSKLLPVVAQPAVQAVIDCALASGLGVTVFMVTLYLARLAERVPDEPLARRTRRSAAGFVVCLLGPIAFVGCMTVFRNQPSTTRAQVRWVATGVVLGATLSLVLLVYAIDLLRLWWTYRKIFRRCVYQSRRLSAT